MEDSKRFPANVQMDCLTFLNDKKVNGELYAYLQGLSDYEVINKKQNLYQTYVLKHKLPTQAKICEALGIKSPKTLKTHLGYLIENEYVVDQGDRYLLPERENIYFLIPLETLQYLNDNCKEHVIKIYIYLGQRYKWACAQGKMYYDFTLEELGNHIGLKVKNSSRGYQMINNALTLLDNSGLIGYSSFFDGQMPKKRLILFSYQFNKHDR